MEQPTFQQSHHTELITANLSAATSDYISDKTNSCSVSSSHLFFNKVRTASQLRVCYISVVTRWETGTSTVCAEHTAPAPRLPEHHCWRQHRCTTALRWKRWKICSSATWNPGNSTRTSLANRLPSISRSAHNIRKASAAVSWWRQVLPTSRQDKWHTRRHSARILGRHCRGKACARNGKLQN